MAAAENSSGGIRTKPSTRSSIRHSLNLASMGKALVDVMNKDGRESEKNTKKAKEAKDSRRLSAKPAGTAPRTSIGDIRPPIFLATPEAKTITRRRVSAGQRSSADEPSTKLADSQTPQRIATVTRSTSLLRPRNTGSSSALPKYRPRSVVMGSIKKPPSPIRVGTRKLLSSSGDESEELKDGISRSSTEKFVKPSGLSQETGALEVNLSGAMHITPSPTRGKPSTPTSAKSSPTRPAKATKASTFTSVATMLPRPPSSTSSSSYTPRTPKTPSLRSALGFRRNDREQGSQRASPSPQRSARANSESPLARHSYKDSKPNTPLGRKESPVAGNMSHISEGMSETEDSSDVDDVEILLAPVASLAAPTPAMPRIQQARNRQRLAPQTPTRSFGLLPSRANLSYLSPLPPDSDSPPSLRPPRPEGTDSRATRGSILSWEQLATNASRTLGEEDIDSMLADIPAPFQSEAVSPTPSTLQLDIPESPCLSALPSPGGYGSISQVLLPDVTPSPAVHPHMPRYELSSELPAVDAAIVTLLRLQLASAENTAKQRLVQLQSMEEQIHDLKDMRLRETEELAKQVAFLEEQLHGNLEIRERADEERLAYAASLEDQLRHAQTFRDQAIDEAVIQTRKNAEASQAAALKFEQEKWDAVCAARAAATSWDSVRDLAESELDMVKGNKEMLSILLSELDQVQKQVMLVVA